MLREQIKVIVQLKLESWGRERRRVVEAAGNLWQQETGAPGWATE
jgi:hypothetical protein